MTDPSFALTDRDKASDVWLRLRAHLTDRLADARLRNDQVLSEPETAMLRGEIRCLKRLLALGDDRPVLTGDDEAPGY
jgi:hypothetical protein